jgi:hypothetical protein
MLGLLEDILVGFPPGFASFVEFIVWFGEFYWGVQGFKYISFDLEILWQISIMSNINVGVVRGKLSVPVKNNLGHLRSQEFSMPTRSLNCLI